jgi:hypothetical protein
MDVRLLHHVVASCSGSVKWYVRPGWKMRNGIIIFEFSKWYLPHELEMFSYLFVQCVNPLSYKHQNQIQNRISNETTDHEIVPLNSIASGST